MKCVEIILFALLIVIILFILSFYLNYKMRFGRRIEGEKDFKYADFPDMMHTKVTIPSSLADLAGFIYEADECTKKKIIVWVHGMGVTHRAYLPEIHYFVKKGYYVFAFDYTANGESGGKTMLGFSQWIVDLENVLTYIQTKSRFKERSIILAGHSLGGYAVAAVLNNPFKNIAGIVTLSGINSGREFFKLYKNTPLHLLFQFYLLCTVIYEKKFYGKKGKYTAVGGINRSKCPTLIYYSKDDKMAPWPVSIASKKDEIMNPKVEYEILSDKGHMVTRVRGVKGKLNEAVMERIAGFMEELSSKEETIHGTKDYT